MTSRDAITILYIALFLIVVPTVVFTVISAYLVHRKSWWLMATSNLGMLFTLAALIVQRSPHSSATVIAAMTWIQRAGITTWIVGSIWLTFHLMTMENGQLAVVRDVMKLGPVRRVVRKLWRRDDGTMANRGDAA